MKKKHYQQYCPMSYALDVIGDRWTLHIIRDLGFGARRFTDLHNGLPGLATNLLSKRLKDMEADGLIAKKTLPPPASSTVYELTKKGQSLQTINSALSEWGMQFLDVPAPDDDFLGVVPAMSSLYRFYDSGTAKDTTVACEFHTQGEVFTASMDHGQLTVHFGTVDDPDVTIELHHTKTLVALINHVTTIDKAMMAGDMEHIAGDFVALQAFVDAYPSWSRT